MPRGFGQDTHRRGKQKRKHYQHAHRIDRIRRVSLCGRVRRARRVGREMVHDQYRDYQQYEDYKGDDYVYELVDAGTGVETYVGVCCFCAEGGSAEEALGGG